MSYSDQHHVPTVRFAGQTVPTGLLWSGIAVIVLGVLGFWVLANNLGTGDAEAADVRARFRSFVESVADGDGDAACAMMQAASADAFAERAALNLGVEPGSCSEMIEQFSDGRSDADSTSLRGAEILEVRMLGGNESINLPPDSAEVDIGAGTVVLERRTGCAGAPECWMVFDGGPVYRMADPTRGD